ncbi:hypothetical protein C0995_004438 [Termitomyces sp. Mi166|nr:hypothetical protein C0995_004438 [Termitomyces sp. Mi166\
MNHDVGTSSRRSSSVSRSQSLIKKNIAPHDLQPSDVLIDRFVAWKAIGIADIENNTAKELTRLGAVIQVPFRAGNQFLGEGGLQDIYYGIRDNTRVIADQHANLGRTIDSSIVQHLQKLRTEIKAHIKAGPNNVQNDTGKLATNVAKERELSMRLIAELSSNISNLKNRPMSVTHRTDPYVSNQAVERQLHRQVHEENLLQKSIIIMQQNSAHFEEGIVRAIQSAWQTYDEWASRSTIAIQDSSRALSLRMSSLAPDREWISFSARSDHLLDPDTPLRNPANITYPSKDDPSVLAVHTGYLERKKRFTRTYRESYFVLTAAGFLHEYASNDPATSDGITPMFSLFLPACTLGPPSVASSKSHKFHIEGRKDGTGTTKGRGGLGGLRALASARAGHAWSFRARSREDMMEWWNDLRMLCARYLVASEQMERSGPVAAAVRAAGYVSEDEDEEEEEEEGSSVEEEEQEQDEQETYEQAREELPSYTRPPLEKTHGVEIGPNGYAIEKKSDSRKSDDDAQPDPDANSNNNRRLSARQQEKAPEGREPHVPPPSPDHEDELEYVDADDAVRGDGRFHEAL